VRAGRAGAGDGRIVTLASGREERNSRWAHSRRRYNAGYGIKSRADMQAVLAFFEERRGRFHAFLWRDGLDHSSRRTPKRSTRARGDGVTVAFQLVKTYGADFDPMCGRSPSRWPRAWWWQVDGERARHGRGSTR
jgi:uncharacterized protein (TIGR02217 family)